MNYSELLGHLIPETIMVVVALAVLAMDLGWRHRVKPEMRLRRGAWLTTLGCAAAAGWLWTHRVEANWHDGMLVLHDLNRWMKIFLLVLTAMTAWLSVGSTVRDHIGEYFTLMLLATVGMMFLVATENVLMIFVSLELLSLSLYIMTGYRKSAAESAESALKYFLFGGMSAAFLLFGVSWLYGLSGELNLPKMAAGLGGEQPTAMLVVALIMVVMGLGFKVAAVPFHFWAPDAYQGAPIPSAAFVAAGSKVASFYILAKVTMLGFAGASGVGEETGWGWIPVVGVVAALSLLVGNLAALAQTSVRRLLAYSAVAQAGYILVGMMANNGTGLASVIYYAVTYAVTTLGAFGIVGWVQAGTGSDHLNAFAGLGRRAPAMSFCLLIFLLSLAGIPPLAGFFGKFYLFTAALASEGSRLHLLWLVILAVAMSAVSLYYYLKVLKQVYILEGDKGAAPLEVPLFSRLWLGAMAFLVLLLGCLPGLILHRIVPAIQALSL